jgi:hypothetical protein
MAAVDKRIASTIAHLPGVKGAVYAEGREIQARAEALFAVHNRPGGHEITGNKQDTDYLVAMSGPVPIVIEFGREGYTTQRGGRTVEVGPMQGLHILGKAAGI